MATSPEDRVALRVLPKHEDLEQARNALLSTLPEQGLGVEETVQHLRKDITKGFNLASISPNYYGFVTGGVTEAAGIADNIVTEYDQNVQVSLPMVFESMYPLLKGTRFIFRERRWPQMLRTRPSSSCAISWDSIQTTGRTAYLPPEPRPVTSLALRAAVRRSWPAPHADSRAIPGKAVLEK